ncbi:hypothetical protein HanXRQr2_Chr06g0267271 [Helianthus annuus]|uniref:Uncharacterized protein n=1 Tax=Helianthus annuus TaxID=4232 RepID=A0A9K3NKT1_HELAN|nr:hypothetical protein HanXRQr2_Chr06g0267271 [Helianthus annuus]
MSPSTSSTSTSINRSLAASMAIHGLLGSCLQIDDELCILQDGFPLFSY